MPDAALGDWTPEQIQKEADEFLEVCRKAAISMVRLNNMQLAHDLLIDAILWVTEYHRLMDEQLLLDVQADMNRPSTSTLKAFRR